MRKKKPPRQTAVPSLREQAVEARQRANLFLAATVQPLIPKAKLTNGENAVIDASRRLDTATMAMPLTGETDANATDTLSGEKLQLHGTFGKFAGMHPIGNGDAHSAQHENILELIRRQAALLSAVFKSPQMHSAVATYGKTTMQTPTTPGMPFQIVEAALRDISISTLISAMPVDSTVRQIVTAAVESAYRKGLVEGQAAGDLMTNASEEVAQRRIENLGNIATVASMWALCAREVTIDADDLQIGAWIVGAQMYETHVNPAGGITYSLDFDNIEKGYENFKEGEKE